MASQKNKFICPRPTLVIALLLTLGLATSVAQTPPTAVPGAPTGSAVPGLYNPVADRGAAVILGKARFTVLTPQLIRMEWAADGKFEDHASFVFLNRRLPVPKFTASVTKSGTNELLLLTTDLLRVTYSVSRNRDGRFNAGNLSVNFH